jgi:hypothetical protein
MAAWMGFGECFSSMVIWMELCWWLSETLPKAGTLYHVRPGFAWKLPTPHAAARRYH